MQVCVEQNWASVAWLDDPGPSTEGSGVEVEVELEVDVVGDEAAEGPSGITTTPVAGGGVAHTSSEPYPEIEQLRE
jgi:hypothetical protein